MRSMVKGLLFSIILGVSFLGSLTAFAVNGSFDNGFSETTRGMAGSGAALPQDSLIAAINPAGMVFVGKRVDLGLTVYVPFFFVEASPGVAGPGRIIAPTTRIDNSVSLMALPDFGVNWVINPLSTFGISVYSLGGFSTIYKTALNATTPVGPSPGFLGGGTVLSELRQAVASLTYAHKITRNSSFGVSLLLAGQTFRGKGSSGLGIFTKTFNQTGVLPTNLTGNGEDYSYGAGLRFGWMVNMLHKIISLAVSYQPVIPMTKLKKYSDLFPEGGSFNIPSNGVIGLALHLAKHWVFTADVQEIWYDTVAAYSRSNAALLNGTCSAANPQACMGGAMGPGLGWRNSTAWKFGVQWVRPNGWIWRAGYNYARTVVRPNQILDNIIAPGAIIQHLFSAGFTKIVNAKNRLTVFMVFIPNQKLTGVNAFSGGTQTITIKTSGLGGGVSWAWLFP